MSPIYCIYRESEIIQNMERHVRQFKESRQGNQAPMFPDGLARIEIEETDRYQVKTKDGEVLFIGRGYEEAFSRSKFADTSANVEVIKEGKRYTVEQYEQELEQQRLEEEAVTMT